MSRSTPPAHGSGSDKVLNVNWGLLGRRLRHRGKQYVSSARYRASQTEYIPPAWMTHLRLTWFRLGLIALAAFVFTQKQIDFTVTVGAAGETAAQVAGAPAEQTSALSMLPSPSRAAAPRWSPDRYEEAATRAYIDRFERVARTEAGKFGIPVPVKLAMAILESDAGEGVAAQQDNNHFPTATPRHRFDNAWSSWRAHSQAIQERYPRLAYESVNHQQWIAALAKTDYSDDPAYAEKLLKIIERFGLDRL
ncbi:flagellum-specific peptidoglycan hydrolase FlgJ [Lewinella marina]|uniref:Mannosyl-glycoprotein endo-beta-N-acetylglucosamidase-like domain-containing protein n=1 Tax=Neolewinella marina TaxID=438751 RepID=A0A2G0CF67_9BACT|nr:glucosaminidase domain-containing protein [Neolewinella marina]NJB85702.1 flagellum-specific peptidoglycan hydrolase FlgJ [Neolewinella marina]PHK98619.1 hypothetical protein CGL56_09105 [Neolewinella marina]